MSLFCCPQTNWEFCPSSWITGQENEVPRIGRVETLFSLNSKWVDFSTCVLGKPKNPPPLQLNKSLLTALWIEIHSVFCSLWLTTLSYIFTFLSEAEADEHPLLQSSWKSILGRQALKAASLCSRRPDTCADKRETTREPSSIMVLVCVIYGDFSYSFFYMWLCIVFLFLCNIGSLTVLVLEKSLQPNSQRLD